MKQLENIKNKYPTTSWKAVMEGAVDLEDYVNNPMNCYDVAANLGGMKEISFDKVLQMKWLSELVKRKRADDTFHIFFLISYLNKQSLYLHNQQEKYPVDHYFLLTFEE